MTGILPSKRDIYVQDNFFKVFVQKLERKKRNHAVLCLKQNKSVVKIVKAVLQISEFGRLQLIFRLHHIV